MGFLLATSVLAADGQGTPAGTPETKAARVVRPAGFVHGIHWRYDPATPRGPSMEIRPRPEQIIEWARMAGLSASSPVLDLPPWHYGVRFQRSAS